MLSKILNKLKEERYLGLFISLVLTVVITAANQGASKRQWVSVALMSLIVVSSVHAYSVLSQRLFRMGICFGFIVILLAWIPGMIFDNNVSHLITNVAYLPFFITTAILVFYSVVKQQLVDINVILGAISCYLLIGFSGSLVFSLLEQIQQNALSIPEDLKSEFFNYIYFSFVTMTTLGYGDIAPLTPEAKAMAILLALTGQLYIATVIAIMASKFVRKKRT